MENNHTVNKEFAERLEWQLATEYRRQSKFKDIPSAGRKHPFLRAAAVVLCSMLAGAVILKAVEGLKDSWKRELEIARVQTSLEISKARLKMVTEIVAQMKKQHAEGTMDQLDWQNILAMGKRVQLELKRAKIDYKEVAITGRSPRNELFAPLVQGEDFVSQRLHLDKEWAEMEVTLIKIQLDRLKTLAKEKLIQSQEVTPVENKVQEQQNLADEIDRQLKLRAEFLKGRLSASQVEGKEKLSKARLRVKQAEAKFTLIVEAAGRMEVRVKDGLASSRELGPLQFELKAAEADLRLAKLELSVLQKHLADQQ